MDFSLEHFDWEWPSDGNILCNMNVIETFPNHWVLCSFWLLVQKLINRKDDQRRAILPFIQRVSGVERPQLWMQQWRSCIFLLYHPVIFLRIWDGLSGSFQASKSRTIIPIKFFFGTGETAQQIKVRSMYILQSECIPGTMLRCKERTHCINLSSGLYTHVVTCTST